MNRTIFAYMVAIVVVAVSWIFPISNSHVFTTSSASPEEADNNTNFQEIENVPNDGYLTSNITINGFELTADLALTNDQREKGLSVKDKLKENEAMLFVSEESAKHSFWMKDMKFPIDIIWLDSDGKVVHIEQNLQPCVSVFICTSYSPNADSQYVLETVAGFTQRHNVSVGTHIDFELAR